MLNFFHLSLLLKINLYTINYDESVLPEMVGIDSEGFNLRIGARVHRMNFSQEVTTAMEVREALVNLARQEAV